MARYGYDDLRRRRNVTFGNGVIQSFNFDAVSRLASLTNDLSGTANDLSATFAYNPASQIGTNVRTGDAYAWTGHFNENKTGTANGLNQLTQVGTKSLTHDAKGNVTAFGTKSFTYSGENLLLTGPNSTSLTYDPLMRLQQVTSGATTRFAYDGLDRIAEYACPDPCGGDGGNVLQRRYVHGPSVDDPIVWYEGFGTTNRRFLSADERGSIVSVTDSAGTLLGVNRYDEYGQPQSTNLGAFGYTGQAWLPSIGAWYYKARAYDAELGRFLQTDPAGYGTSLNLYPYTANEPVNLVDPDGRRELTIGEKNLLDVFGVVDLTGWRINEAWDLSRAVAYGWGTIGMPTLIWSEDYSTERRPSLEVNTFYHEFYHAFEYSVGLASFRDLAALQSRRWINDRLGIPNVNIYDYRDPPLAGLPFMDLPAEARAQYFADCLTSRNTCSRMLNGGLNFAYQGIEYHFERLSNGALAIVSYNIFTGSRLPRRYVWPVKTK